MQGNEIVTKTTCMYQSDIVIMWIIISIVIGLTVLSDRSIEIKRLW